MAAGEGMGALLVLGVLGLGAMLFVGRSSTSTEKNPKRWDHCIDPDMDASEKEEVKATLDHLESGQGMDQAALRDAITASEMVGYTKLGACLRKYLQA